MNRLSLLFVMTLTLFALWSCGPAPPAQPVSGEEEARIKAELRDRSFRQFEPSRTGARGRGHPGLLRASQHLGPVC